MIEKVMKAVKSSNKRRGRNITIGAVVGFLLSCTAVMGADNYLWIKEEGGKIEFNTFVTMGADGEGGNWDTANPYEDAGNIWDTDIGNKIYTNNITLSSNGANGVNENNSISYGLRLSGNLTNVNFVNNASITGIMTSSGNGYGIFNSAEMGNIENKGIINGTGDIKGYGIYNSDSAKIGDIINSETISGAGSGNYGYGIYNYNSAKIGDITNTGIINGTGVSSGYGIWNSYNSAKIGNITNTGVISGSGAGSRVVSYGIYNSDSAKIGNITNIGVISGTGAGTSSAGYGYGIYNYTSAEIGNIINTGIIRGIGTSNSTSASSHGYGIYSYNTSEMGNIENAGIINGIGASSGYGINNISSTIRDITNNIGIINTGIINGSATATGSSSGYGINNNTGTIGDIKNAGIISGIGISSSNSSSGYGIYNDSNSEKMGNIENTGIISGTTTSSSSSGGDVSGITNNTGTIGDITNTGVINGSGTGVSYGYGINNKSGTKIGNITNTGVIYGKDNAIKNNSGTIATAKNYGILVNGDDGKGVVDGLDIDTSAGENKIVNKGLIFKAVGGNYKVEKDEYGKFGETFDNDAGIKIINAKAEGTADNITGTESLKLENGTLSYNDSKNNHKEENISSGKGYILNGITNTLEVSGKNNELDASVINAYKTAVVMGSDDSTLILNNTVVNGGLLGNDPTISITGSQNILTIQGNSVVNGEMKSTGENNTLSLNGNAEDGMNMLHNITGFTNMNIDNNVTFFENVEVTGTETVTIAETGTLNLRLKNTGATENVAGVDIPKATHAFSGSTGMIIQGEGNGVNIAGTLKFITNGIGKKIYVGMKDIELRNLYFKTSSIIDGYEVNDKVSVILGAYENLDKIYKPENTRKGSQNSNRYESLNNIYKGIYSSKEDNLDALRVLISFDSSKNNYDESTSDEEQLKNLMSYLGSIYTETPYSYSSELSRKSMGMFRDIITENQFKPNLNQWLIMGGLTHTDGGTKDSYYGQNYHGIDTGTADVDVDMKLTGAYALSKYGYSENISLGVIIGGNKSEAKLPMSKVKGNSGYIGAFAENYRGNRTLKAGAGIQYSEYDANRGTLGGHSYSDKYSDMTYDIYLNGRYSHSIGENLFLEPYGTLSYTYVDQEGADEGSKVLAIETDSKSFDYTTAKVGVDLKKVIPHEKGKSTLSAGVSYTRLLTGADEENITGRFKGKDATDFDILVAHKNEHSIGLNAKYVLELESGILFDVKGSYSVERDSHNGTGKNRNKGEWIVGAGLGYKF